MHANFRAYVLEIPRAVSEHSSAKFPAPYMRTCVYVHMYVRVYVCVDVHSYVYVYVCVYMCMYMCMYIMCMYLCMYMCMYVCMYMSMYMHMNMYMYMYTVTALDKKLLYPRRGTLDILFRRLSVQGHKRYPPGLKYHGFLIGDVSCASDAVQGSTWTKSPGRS